MDDTEMIGFRGDDGSPLFHAFSPLGDNLYSIDEGACDWLFKVTFRTNDSLSEFSLVLGALFGYWIMRFIQVQSEPFQMLHIL